MSSIVVVTTPILTAPVLFVKFCEFASQEGTSYFEFESWSELRDRLGFSEKEVSNTTIKKLVRSLNRIGILAHFTSMQRLRRQDLHDGYLKPLPKISLLPAAKRVVERLVNDPVFIVQNGLEAEQLKELFGEGVTASLLAELLSVGFIHTWVAEGKKTYRHYEFIGN